MNQAWASNALVLVPWYKISHYTPNRVLASLTFSLKNATDLLFWHRTMTIQTFLFVELYLKDLLEISQHNYWALLSSYLLIEKSSETYGSIGRQYPLHNLFWVSCCAEVPNKKILILNMVIGVGKSNIPFILKENISKLLLVTMY